MKPLFSSASLSMACLFSAVSACLCCSAEAGPGASGKLSKREISKLQKSRNQMMMSYQPRLERRISVIRSQWDDERLDAQGMSGGGLKEVLGRHVGEVNSLSYEDALRASAGSGAVGPEGKKLEDEFLRLVGSPKEIWHKGYAVTSEDEYGGLGRLLIGHIGADHMISPEVLVGLSFQIEECSYETKEHSSEAEGAGFMIGPYFTAMIEEDLFLDGALKVGKSWGNVDAPAFTETFETFRLYGELSLAKMSTRGNWASRFTGGLNYAQDVKKESVDSLGVRSGRQTAIQTDFRLGHDLSYDLLQISDGVLQLASAIDLYYPLYEYGAGQWDLLSGDLRGDVVLGVSYGKSAHINVQASGVGSDTESVGISFGYHKAF